MNNKRFFPIALIACFIITGIPGSQAQEEQKSQDAAWYDFMKGIEIGPGVLDVGGSIRVRSELFDNFNIKGYGTDDTDGILLERLRLDLDYRIHENLNFFVQMQDAHYWFSDLDFQDNFGTVCPYENPFDLKKAYVDWRRIGDSPFGFRAGRQAISYRDNRVFGPGDWGNTGRYTWDAIKLYVDADFAQTDLIWANRVISDKSNFDRHHYDFTTYALYSQIKNLPVDLDLFYIFKNDGEGTYAGESGIGDLQAHSLGFYLNGKCMEDIDWSGTFAYQAGDYGKDDLSAFGFNAKLGYTFNDAPWTPRLGMEFSYASGDDDPADGEQNTFDGLFGAVDKFYGRMNMFAWMNLEDYQATLSAKPVKGVNLSLDYHYLRLAEEKDAWYYCSGKAFRSDPTGVAGQDLGHEFDLLAKWKVNKNVEWFAGYSHFIPEDFAKQTGPHDDADWFFLQFTYSF